MPELPEAETIARGLRGPVVDRRVRAVEVLHDDLLDEDPERFRERVVGARIRSVRRRGKNLVLVLEPRTNERDVRASVGERFLVVNLGMSGRLLHRRPDDSTDSPTHPGVRFRLDDGRLLVYHDVRRFGRLRVLDPPEFRSWSDALGPEPLSDDFTARALEAALADTRTPARSFLLDQRRVAGVGNIYANEALFRAGIHPRRRTDTLDATDASRLHRALRRVLREAVDARGTTLRDYRTAQGWRGTYSDQLRVYGRESLPCPNCGTPIERIVFGGRSAFVCPACQPPPGEGS